MADAIDLQEAMERVSDDKELFLELLDIYEEDFLKKREGLTQAVASKDIGKIKEIAHSMKGASGNISAKRMHESCLKLEQLAKSNSTDGMQALLGVIDESFGEIKAYAVRLKKEWGGG